MLWGDWEGGPEGLSHSFNVSTFSCELVQLAKESIDLRERLGLVYRGSSLDVNRCGQREGAIEAYRHCCDNLHKSIGANSCF